MSDKLDRQREERRRWIAGMIGEPAENVTLAPNVEPVEPDPKKCGMGKGADCCVFLTAGPDGFECERHGPLHYTLVGRAKSMASKRIPEEAYPACMSITSQ